MKKNWLILTTGFALFAMFFGSGNLVFPITVGTQSEGHYILSSLGIIVTGVIVPFLGVLGMLLFRGSLTEFFASFGKKGTFLFSFFALAIMGPFGVLARCLTVAHGAIEMLIPQANLVITSLVLCFVIFILTINKNKMVSFLGSLLTPFLMVAIAFIAFFGLKDGFSDITLKSFSSFESFKVGFFQGYQTMDLLAAFFFSTFIINHLQSKDKDSSLKIFLKSSLIGATILSLVYLALVMLGYKYSPELINAQPQEMLGIIALKSLGKFAAPAVCITVLLACLTTAIVLTSLFADFLKNNVLKNKINTKMALITTLAIGFGISNLEFSGIAKILGPILEVIYPALIVMTLANLVGKFFGFKQTHWPVTATIAIRILTL
jgi:LIVCS family branched-chain amino acid:cation transporter